MQEERYLTKSSPMSGEICMSKSQQRLQREEGFTLVEMLVVIVIIGILLAIAVPSYLGFKDRANKATAKANLRSAIPLRKLFSRTTTRTSP
jgi:prepilin-type N-terminal cleavage/methylation domain-containing protein